MEGKKQKETRLTKKKILPKILKKGRMYIIEYKDIQSFTCNKYSSNNNETNPQCRRRKGGGGQLFGSKDVNLILSVTYISLITHYFQWMPMFEQIPCLIKQSNLLLPSCAFTILKENVLSARVPNIHTILYAKPLSDPMCFRTLGHRSHRIR